MKKFLVMLLAALMLMALAQGADADVGRDILLVVRYVGSWEYTDDAMVLLSDGTRLHFDLRGLPQEVLSDSQELLYFLRLHGLSPETALHGRPLPDSKPALDADFTQKVRELLGQVKDTPFESSFHAFDAGSFDLYGVIRVDGEARLSLLAESGTFVGQSPDPAAQALVTLVGDKLLLD